MKKMLAAALTSVAMAVSGLAVVAAPSEAVTSLGIQASSLTANINACRTTRVTITGDWAGDPINSIDVNVNGPYGGWVGGDYWVDQRSSSVSVNVELCGYYNAAGWYTVTAEAEGYDENYENGTFASASKSFKFTKIDPRARASITKKKHRAGGKYKWKVPGRLFRAGRGYVGRRVAIEAYIIGDWMQIDAQRTRKKGRFGWKFKPNGLSWRYVFYGNANTKPAATAAFRTPRKGRGARETSADPRSFIS